MLQAFGQDIVSGSSIAATDSAGVTENVSAVYGGNYIGAAAVATPAPGTLSSDPTDLMDDNESMSDDVFEFGFEVEYKFNLTDAAIENLLLTRFNVRYEDLPAFDNFELATRAPMRDGNYVPYLIACKNCGFLRQKHYHCSGELMANECSHCEYCRETALYVLCKRITMLNRHHFLMIPLNRKIDVCI